MSNKEVKTQQDQAELTHLESLLYSRYTIMSKEGQLWMAHFARAQTNTKIKIKYPQTQFNQAQYKPNPKTHLQCGPIGPKLKQLQKKKTLSRPPLRRSQQRASPARRAFRPCHTLLHQGTSETCSITHLQ
ncbi:hypothetical protein V6Z11_A02G045100 [Gossypium hirsutum]